MSNWPFLPLVGAAFSIAIGGEIKSVERSQTFGMLGAIAGAVVIWLVTITLCNSVFGYEVPGHRRLQPHRGAWACRPTPPSPCWPGCSRAPRSSACWWSIGFIFWMWMWIPGMHTFGGARHRGVELRPGGRRRRGGRSRPTRHTPVVAIIFTMCIGILFLALFVFTEFFSSIIILIEAAVLAWAVVLGAGIFFPYLRPQIYEKSPISHRKILGLPMMTVGCFLGFCGRGVLLLHPVERSGGGRARSAAARHRGRRVRDRAGVLLRDEGHPPFAGRRRDPRVQGDPHRIGSVRFGLCPHAAGAHPRSGRSCEA